MTDRVSVVAPRAPTPLPTAPGASRGTRLPDDLRSEQIERLAVFCAVAAAVWTWGLAMDAVIMPLLLDIRRPAVHLFIEVFEICASAVMYQYVRSAKHSYETKSAAGLAHMLLIAAGVATLNVVAMSDRLPADPQVSWVAVVILVFSMFAPATPLRMLAASLVAASIDPLANWIAYAAGWPALPPLHALLHYLPNHICAIVAMVPPRVFQRLGRRLREAQELGSYQLIELLGHGGMGEVWRAQHRLLARDAAIKLVRPEVLGAGTDADARLVLRRFEREAKATAALTSPHTIRVFDFGVTNDGNFYYVMELLTGRDLETFVRDFGPVPAERAIFLLRQICHSLADAHARGLVHRDIKPANIYLCRMGLEYDFVKVLDFGLAKYRGRSSVRQTLPTVEHQTTGTPAYMAPEIILAEADVDRRADVYALGCVAYYLLTGHLVFEADTPMKMLLQHVQAVPTPPSQRTELPIPAEMDAIVLACLRKDPNERPQDAEELLRLAWGCRTCDTWSNAEARRWWQTHLPELTGPLTVEDSPSSSDRQTVALT